MRTVHRGLGEVRRLDPRPASPPAPLRRTTTATARLLPTTAARMSRRNVRSLLTTITAVTRSRPTTTIADLRSHALTIRLLRPHIQRRELIPHRAAAIRLHLAPTPHPAAARAVVAVEAVAIAVEVAAAGVAEAVEATSAAAVARAVVVEAAEAHTAVEVPAHTVTAKSFY